MNLKQLLVLTGVLAVSALVAFLVLRGRESELGGESRTGDKLFPGFPLNDVASVLIESTDGNLELARGEQGAWQVAQRDNYPAATDRVQRLLRNLWNAKIIQAMNIGPSQFGRMALKKPAEVDADNTALAGTVVTFRNAEGETLRTLTVGKEQFNRSDADPTGMGLGGGSTSRYVMTSLAEDQVFEVNNSFESVTGDSDSWPSNFGNINVEPGDWLLKDFVKLSKVKSVSIDFQEEDKTDWGIAREEETGEFAFVNAVEGEEIDTTKTGTYKSLLSSPRFKDILTSDQAGAVDMATGVKAVVTTFDGFTYQFDVGPKDDESNTFPVSVTVSAEIAQERTPGEEESEEDKESLDAEFATKKAELEEKLATESALAGHWFALNSWDADELVKERSEMVKQPETESTDGETSGLDLGTSSGGPVIEAVTPPVRVPPLPPAEISDTPPGIEDLTPPPAETPGVEVPETPAPVEPAEEDAVESGESAEEGGESADEPAEPAPVEPAEEAPAEPAEENGEAPAEGDPSGS